jgi:hypothetical protein
MLQFVLRDGFEACEEDVVGDRIACAQAQASRLDGRRVRSPLSRTH